MPVRVRFTRHVVVVTLTMMRRVTVGYAHALRALVLGIKGFREPVIILDW